MQNEPPTYPIASVDNALKLLLMLRERDAIRVAEASTALGVGRSTSHRLLAMLQYRGFVTQDSETRAYRSGPALIDIALHALGQLDVRSHVLPHMRQLTDQLGETVQLIQLEGTNALFLDAVEADRALRSASRAGLRVPAHCVSGGKALLAELSPERLRELYPSPRLTARTERSITSRKELEAELEQIRSDGYAAGIGESEPDIAAVAAVVRGSQGTARAAIAVSMPISRFDDDNLPGLADAVMQTARVASDGLG